MNCNTVRKHIPAYAEKSLPDDLAAKVRAHIERCPGCASELAEYEKYFSLMSALPVLRAPDDFLHALHRKLDLPEPEQRKPRKTGLVKKLFFPAWPKIPLEAAGLLASAALVFVILKPAADIEKAVMPETAAPVGSLKEDRASERPARRFAKRSKPEGTLRDEKMRVAAGDRAGVMGDRMVKKAAQSAPRERIGTSEKPGPFTLVLVLNEAPLNKMSEEYETAAPGMKRKAEEKKEISRDADLAAAKQYRGPYPLADKDGKGRPALKSTERVRLIVGRYGGTILSERYNRSTGLLETLELTIPGEHYGSFIADLRAEGSLKGVPAGRISRGQPVRLRLTIESPR